LSQQTTNDQTSEHRNFPQAFTNQKASPLGLPSPYGGKPAGMAINHDFAVHGIFERLDQLRNKFFAGSLADGAQSKETMSRHVSSNQADDCHSDTNHGLNVTSSRVGR
jgi:hypothetical protein